MTTDTASQPKIDQGPPDSIAEAALECVLLFHGGGEWDLDKRLAWWNRTGQREATTKVLCDYVRLALGTLRHEIEQLPGENSVEHFERVAKAFYEETGYIRPGKDIPAAKDAEGYRMGQVAAWEVFKRNKAKP